VQEAERWRTAVPHWGSGSCSWREENILPRFRPTTSAARSSKSAPYDDRTIAVNRSPQRLYMGGVLGGGTAVFGAVMLRPSRDDFHPGCHYADRLARANWDWPLSYQDLQPYYDEAEALFGLAHAHDDQFDPLEPPRPAPHRATLSVAPVNQRLIAANRRRGLKPFRLPLAIDAAKCLRCDHCAGFLCPHDARRSSSHLIADAVRRFGLSVRSNVEARRLVLDGKRRVDGVVVVDRATGREETLRATSYALAAGAIGSPALLLQSTLDGLHVGRHYMMHFSPLVIGIFGRPTGADRTFVKQVGFADFYFGAGRQPRKLGLVQSLPAPGPAMLAKAGLHRWPAQAIAALRRHMLPLAGIVEDLPDPENRVLLQSDGTIRLAHRFNDFDRARARVLSREMKRILRRAGAVACVARTLPSTEHVAHQCGTLRMAHSPTDGAVDPDGRLFGHDNLFVVDGSVLPTSLGVGPSLTIAANALRVAEVVAKSA
jgi:choline dehydrogenase-like flavoprotein